MVQNFWDLQEDHAQDCKRVLDVLSKTMVQLVSMKNILDGIALEKTDQMSVDHEVTCKFYKDLATTQDQVESIWKAMVSFCTWVILCASCQLVKLVCTLFCGRRASKHLQEELSSTRVGE